MLNILRDYSDQTVEPFNDKFIYHKKDEDVSIFLDRICKALEIIDGLKYLGSEVETDPTKFSLKKVVEADDEPVSDWISIDESHVHQITLNFHIEKEDNNVHNRDKVDADGIRREDVSIKILFPRIVNDYYFILNGTKYFPISQIIDASSYTSGAGKKMAVTQKTLFMPIILRPNHTTYTSTCGETLTGRVFLLDLFKFKINAFHYYFAKMGMDETIEYLLERATDINKWIDEDTTSTIGDLLFTSETDKGYDDCYTVKISNSLYVNVDIEAYDKFSYLRDLTVTFINMLSGRKIRNEPDYWKKALGRVFTTNTNSQMEKANKSLLSFERILDLNTKSFLRIDDKDKTDSYSIVRWMMYNFDNLLLIDSTNLLNRRIRLYEYLIDPLLRKFSSSTYRGLNSRNLTFTNIRTMISNIGPNFIIKSLINNELLRQVNAVNTIDLFNSALKFTLKGPMSFAEKRDTVEVKYRDVHPSYINFVGLTSSSNSDPGLGGTLVPMIKTDGLYFATEEEFRAQFKE